MLHITRCPNCQTAFRVSDEQLAAHRGRVRCGKCRFVFDARERLEGTAPEKSAKPKPQVADADRKALEAQLDATPLTQSAVYRPIQTPEDEALLTPPKRRTLAKAGGALLIVILLLLLLAQTAFHFRARLSTDYPWLRPLLTQACAPLGCTIPLAHNAELLRSDYTDLSLMPGYDNRVQLVATLRNLAPYPQALPMMEVTLTDDNEQVVYKHRFKPADYLQPGSKVSELAAHDDLQASMVLDLGALRSSGYTVYWFYP
ncbi:DUF3426 domain-containing protein [Chitinibacteraceae bacterium HSL-7]